MELKYKLRAYAGMTPYFIAMYLILALRITVLCICAIMEFCDDYIKPYLIEKYHRLSIWYTQSMQFRREIILEDKYIDEYIV